MVVPDHARGRGRARVDHLIAHMLGPAQRLGLMVGERLMDRGDVGQAGEQADRFARRDRAARVLGLGDARRPVAARGQRVQDSVGSVDLAMTAGEEVDGRAAARGEVGQKASNGWEHVRSLRHEETSSPIW